MGNYSGSAGEAKEVAPWYVEHAHEYLWRPMDFDYRHRFVLSWVWDLPKVPTDHALLRGLLHGWQVYDIGQYQSGGAYTITSGRDYSHTGINRDREKFTGVSVEPVAGSDKTVWLHRAAFAVYDVRTFGTVERGAFHGRRSVRCGKWVFFKPFNIHRRGGSAFSRQMMFNIFQPGLFSATRNNYFQGGGGFGPGSPGKHPERGEYPRHFFLCGDEG